MSYNISPLLRICKPLSGDFSAKNEIFLVLRRFVPQLSLNQRKSCDEIENDRYCTYSLSTKTNDRGTQCRSIFTIHNGCADFNRKVKNTPEKVQFSVCDVQSTGVRGAVPPRLWRRPCAAAVSAGNLSAAVVKSAWSSPCIVFTVRTARRGSRNISRFCLTPRPASARHWNERSLNCGLT